MDQSIRQCPRCANSDPAYFYLGSKGWYCRLCVGFHRTLLDQVPDSGVEVNIIDTEYELPFGLTIAQKNLAERLVGLYERYNVLVHAACGAGKTEIMLDFIIDALGKGYRVGWAIPRRAVVLQLAQRLSGYFPRLKVVAVAQGYTQTVYGDLIICTTHQLFRYYRYFDYLIIDEPDAFPFKGNDLLRNIALSSVRSKLVFLSATPDDFVIKHSEVTLELFSRPHGQPLDIPHVRQLPRLLALPALVYLLLRRRGRLLVFLPTIKLAERCYFTFKYFVCCCLLTSQSSHKEQTVREFAQSDRMVCFSTTVLERGITIPDIDVLVYRADHPIFDLASLIQMAGRVGRTANSPRGTVNFITYNRCEKVENCTQLLKKMNQSA